MVLTLRKKIFLVCLVLLSVFSWSNTSLGFHDWWHWWDDGSYDGSYDSSYDGNYGPSCGEAGGDHCSQSGSCPSGFNSLGNTWDCNPCCKSIPADSSYGDSTYGDSSYGDSTYGDSTYGDATYGDSTYGDSEYGDSSYPGVNCNGKGGSASCNFTALVGDPGSEQAWRGHVSAECEGHGSFGGSGGKCGLSTCLSGGGMWADGSSCWHILNPDSGGNVGDGHSTINDTKDIGGDYTSSYDWYVTEFYANDATWYNIGLGVDGRRVSIDSFGPSSSTVKSGQQFTVNWSMSNAFGPKFLFYGGAITEGGSEGVGSSGPRTFTAGPSAGVADFTVCGEGPGGNGSTQVCSSISVTVEVDLPGPFTLSSGGCFWHGGHGGFDLIWTQSANAEKYEVWRRAWSNGTWTFESTVNGTSYHADEGSNIDWYFKVIAKNKAGQTESNETSKSGCYLPVVDINANPNPVDWNTSSTLNWNADFADSCDASGDWSGGKGTSGSQSTGNLTSSKTYTLTCHNVGGSGSDSVTVDVNVPPAPAGWIRCNGLDSCTIPWNSNANITWHSENTISCSVSPNGWTDWPDGNKNETLFATKTYTMTCQGVDGSTYNDSVTANVQMPPPNNPANVTATQPDYCASGPAVTTSWTYSDPAGNPQAAYEIQLSKTGNFNNPVACSPGFAGNVCTFGKINSGSTSHFSGQGILEFNTTYKVRVRVWNNFDVVSGWTESGNFKTPNFAYPQVNFTWTSNGISQNPSPPLGKDVQFTDQTAFSPQSNPNNHDWDWTFGDGTSSTQQNPTKVYNTEGVYNVTLTATDSQNQTCSRTRGPLIIQKPIPKWREVAPR